MALIQHFYQILEVLFDIFHLQFAVVDSRHRNSRIFLFQSVEQPFEVFAGSLSEIAARLGFETEESVRSEERAALFLYPVSLDVLLCHSDLHLF